MLLSAVSVLVVAQSSSEIPEGLMNNPVLSYYLISCLRRSFCEVLASKHSVQSFIFLHIKSANCIKFYILCWPVYHV